ncbi:potassium voltage-gated channel subfamily A member 6-like [Hydractinia symbiolongicarpus]|uniref:potassium voltage-gated channel subfamily A member 6-like n=1 Tax=Hydractinia symbiolongicarpus TaxID=13093 RepID=UPI00254A6E0F|nr:potassium voltage-gated channel subfamily A member 6-like [Hydractinia symbiolongicarpus]
MFVRNVPSNQRRTSRPLIKVNRKLLVVKKGNHRNYITKSSLPKIDENQSSLNDRTCIQKNTSNPKTLKKVKVCLMVGGQLFETFESTLEVFPNTLLGNKQKRNEYFNQNTNMFVFDRCSICFDAILFYYQSQGILSKPGFVARDTFINEMEFFMIDRHLDDLHRHEFICTKDKTFETPEAGRKFIVWCNKNVFLITMLYYVNMLVVVSSVAAYCIETLPDIQNKKIWFILEAMFSCCYAFEYIFRVYAASDRNGYTRSVLGATDLASSLPFFIQLLTGRIQNKRLHNFINFTRVVRIFKVTRFNRGFSYMLSTFKECRTNVMLLVTYVFICSLIFASFIYSSESENDPSIYTPFVSLPESLWFAVITTTGVGYGDIYPTTLLGKFCGGILAVLGVLLFCLPTTIFVFKFVECYYLPEILSPNCNSERKALLMEVRQTFLEDFDAMRRERYT